MFFGSSIKFQDHSDQKIGDVDPIQQDISRQVVAIKSLGFALIFQ